MDAKLEDTQAELEVTKAELNITKSVLEAMNVSLIQHHEVQYNGYLLNKDCIAKITDLLFKAL